MDYSYWLDQVAKFSDELSSQRNRLARAGNGLAQLQIEEVEMLAQCHVCCYALEAVLTQLKQHLSAARAEREAVR